ncbi:hypothetical protein [Erythrobacter sp.]|uniref:hypothetical protein n=1 Tax=Erythrobacter sp. TaxID=1042 RepID=UPI0025D549CF|nr:hypothetical protein [Erythrobacter sp.]
MQDDFWSRNGRTQWYEPEPNSKIFLATFFVEVGKIRHGPKWAGAVKKPSSKSALPIKEEIAQAAASGLIQTFVLNPKTYEFQPIARSGWRNPKALAARFSRCRIDANDPVSAAAEGGHHGPIYVEQESATAYLAAIKSASNSPLNNNTLNHLSTYARYMIFIAQKHKIDERAPPPLQPLRTIIMNEWKSWRQTECKTKILPPEAVMTEAMARHIATILRGEEARAAKGGGVKSL